MPTRPAASAHWVFRCSVGATTVILRTTRACSWLVATRRANVVFPARGVATARETLSTRCRYSSRAAACQDRDGAAVPHGVLAGAAGGRFEAALVDPAAGAARVGG